LRDSWIAYQKRGCMNISIGEFGFPAFLGFLMGLVTMTVVGSWLRLMLGLRSDGTLRRRILGFPLLSLVHPIPWLWLVAMPMSGYYFVFVRHSSAAAWFFGIWLLVNILWWAASILMVRHYRKRQLKAKAVDSSDVSAA
jgi:hypothetical protein